jgi:carboxypeptidase Q
MRRFGFLIFLFPALTAYTQHDDSIFISRMATDILQQGKAYEHLRVLCKTVGPRLAGSPQMYKAEQWGVKTLEACGADQVRVQQCMVPRWVRGGKDEAWFSYKDKSGKQVRQVMDVLALGNSIGTGKGGVKAEVLLVKDFEDLEKRKNEIKGKIIFYNYAFNPTYIQTNRAYAEAGVYRRSGPSRAAQYGAIAVVIRSLTQSVDNLPHTGTTSYDSNIAKIPCAAMGLKNADQLSKLLTSGSKVELYLKTMAHFLPDTIGHNVIAELKGSEFPGEYITVGGHLDSWDAAEGAHDDGAGCVQSIEVLRVLKAIGYRPKRTIRVVLFANEENGLRGGTKYAEEAKTKNEKHLFALESDAGGFTPRAFSFTISPEQLEQCRRWVSLLLPYGVYEFRQGGGGADIGPLNKELNVPLAGLSPDSQRYFDVHHARNDVFENVHKRELELGAINMAALIYLVDKYGL